MFSRWRCSKVVINHQPYEVGFMSKAKQAFSRWKPLRGGDSAKGGTLWCGWEYGRRTYLVLLAFSFREHTIYLEAKKKRSRDAPFFILFKVLQGGGFPSWELNPSEWKDAALCYLSVSLICVSWGFLAQCAQVSIHLSILHLILQQQKVVIS